MQTKIQINLSYLEEKALNLFSKYIEKEVPEATQIILFGSRARGKSNSESDIDIAVILSVDIINSKIWNDIWNIKWKVLELLDAEEFPFSLILLTKKDLTSRDFGIEKIIKTEGFELWKRENWP